MKVLEICLMLVLLTSLSSAQLREVLCRYRTFSTEEIGSFYVCQLEVDFCIDELENVWTDFARMEEESAKLNGLVLTAPNCNRFPSHMGDYSWNIELISITPKSDIEVLSNEDLKPYPQLRYLTISGSKIRTLAGDLFKFNSNIQYIDFFSSRQMELVDNNILEGLQSLKFVNFGDCSCINYVAINQQEIEWLKQALIGSCPYSLSSTLTTSPKYETTTENPSNFRSYQEDKIYSMSQEIAELNRKFTLVFIKYFNINSMSLIIIRNHRKSEQ